MTGFNPSDLKVDLPKKKYKVLTLCDHPLSTSGVGVQAGALFNGLLNTGKYKFICLGGAQKHSDYRVAQPHPDMIIRPVDGFGTKDQLKQILLSERPDAVFLFTDPRQFIWTWEVIDEIHQLAPLVYWHVWDNSPYPAFNEIWYKSTDLINCLAHKTYELIQPHFPEKTHYIPHSFPKEIYFPLPEEKMREFNIQKFGPKADWFKVLWVNRNAHRKMGSDVVACFKEFLDVLEKKYGHRNALMIMHTDPFDVEGGNLAEVSNLFGLKDHVMFSTEKLNPGDMNILHNISDVLVNIAKAEGFGLCKDGLSLISTENGLKCLKDIEVGDKVFSSDGKSHKVLATVNRDVKGIYFIKPYKRKELICSENHPYLIKNPTSEKLEWTDAKNLKVGDLLCVKKPTYDCSNEQNKSHLDMTDYVDSSRIHNLEFDGVDIWSKMGHMSKSSFNILSIAKLQKKYKISKFVAEHVRKAALNLPFKKKPNLQNIQHYLNLLGEEKKNLNINNIKLKRFIPANDDLFKFVGWYLAEGSNAQRSGNGSIEINLHKDEINVAEWISNYVFNTFGINGKTQVYGNKSRYVCSSKILSVFMGNLCGVFSHNKQIHKSLYPYLQNSGGPSLLKALFEGDGHENKKKTYWSFTTTSPLLVQQVNDLLLHFNILGYLTQIPATKNKPVYTISICGEEYNKFSRLIGNSVSERKIRSRKALRRTSSDSKFIYVPIVGIKTKNQSRKLWDIQVEDSKDFIVNGGVVAHNSTLIEMMTGKPIIALMTGGMIRQVIDHRDGSENGVAIPPASQQLVGSQMVPYIYEDFTNHKQVIDALVKVFEYTPEQKQAMKTKVLDYATHEFSYEKMIADWDRTLEDTILRFKKNKPRTWELTQLENQAPQPKTPQEATKQVFQQQNIKVDPSIQNLPLDITGHLMKKLKITRASAK